MKNLNLSVEDENLLCRSFGKSETINNSNIDKFNNDLNKTYLPGEYKDILRLIEIEKEKIEIEKRKKLLDMDVRRFF